MLGTLQIDPPDGSLPCLAVCLLWQGDAGVDPLALARLILRPHLHTCRECEIDDAQSECGRPAGGWRGRVRAQKRK